MRFNARLVVSFGIISLLLISPAAYSLTCDNDRRYGVAKYVSSHYGVSAKNEVRDVYFSGSGQIVNSAGIMRSLDRRVPGFSEVGWTKINEYRKFFVAWTTTEDIYTYELLADTTNGYYKFFAYNKGEGNFVGCVCELDSNENHVRCVGSRSKATSDLGFEKGYPAIQGETVGSCNVAVNQRFARFWDLKYGPDTGWQDMVLWGAYNYTRVDYPLIPEFVTYKN